MALTLLITSVWLIWKIAALVASFGCLAFGTQFDVPDFSSMSEFFTFGDAHRVPENLSVNLNTQVSSAKPEGFSTGRLLYAKEAVRMRDKRSKSVLSFSTSFTFSITQQEGSVNRSGSQVEGSGFVFIFGTGNISRLVTGTIGYSQLNISVASKNHSNFFAVQFDVFQNFLIKDVSNNHIGIDVNSAESLYSYNLCGGGTTQCLYPWTGNFYTTWIEYNVASPLLVEVWLANGSLADGIVKPMGAVLRVSDLDLFDVFEDFMYVGFGGTTGYHQNDMFTIHSWRFSSDLMEDTVVSVTDSFNVLLFFKQFSPTWVMLVVLGIVICGTVVLVFLCKWWWARQQQISDKVSLPGITHLMGLRTFSYRELRKATQNFSDGAVIGSGGFGIVYKGVLQTSAGTAIVAIKRLKHTESEHSKNTFVTEVSSISQIRHRNLVQLQGWCHEKKHFVLVFDYMSNGSLDEWLFPRRRRYPNDSKYKRLNGVLPWTLRCSILTGIAAALEYLHEDCVQCILHRDVKSSNIMLDDDLNAHLGDFGLARLMDHDKDAKTTMVAGTLSYMAPELLYFGKATKTSDVYSFGIVILEAVCGRQPQNSSQGEDQPNTALLQSVWCAHEANNILSIVDPKLISPINSDTQIHTQMHQMHMLHLGLLCCLSNPDSRPPMKVVKQIIMQLDKTPEILPTMMNWTPHVPSRRPPCPFTIEGLTGTQISLQGTRFNSSSTQLKKNPRHRRRSRRSSHQMSIESTSAGHELP